MHVLITGASGTAGRFIAAGLTACGHRVTPLGRNPGSLPWSLADTRPSVPGADALVHCAFHHRPGAYRGGEGDDPETFLRLNLDGSLALFQAARDAGVARILLLSSRAVYGNHRRGDLLDEEDPTAPDTLYGRMKTDLEADLRDRGGDIALRATGFYGRPPGAQSHKWSGLFRDYLAGSRIDPRSGTELHGDDLASAVALLLAAPIGKLGDGVFNASDILLDRHDLLAGVRDRTGSGHALPPRAGSPPPGIMRTDRLHALGWQPGGLGRLNAFLDAEFPRSGRGQGAADHQTSGNQPIQSP